MIDSQAIHSIAKSMREFGIAYLKMGDLEMRAGDVSVASIPVLDINDLKTNKPIVSKENFRSFDIDSVEEKEIKHKVEEFTSVMKLSDTDLVDKLFPDHSDEENEAD